MLIIKNEIASQLQDNFIIEDLKKTRFFKNSFDKFCSKNIFCITISHILVLINNFFLRIHHIQYKQKTYIIILKLQMNMFYLKSNIEIRFFLFENFYILFKY